MSVRSFRIRMSPTKANTSPFHRKHPQKAPAPFGLHRVSSIFNAIKFHFLPFLDHFVQLRPGEGRECGFAVEKFRVARRGLFLL